jgi:calcineurin-like phosphoesterase
MKVLMIGDVVAKPGRIAVLERIQDLREQHNIDLAVMNAETWPADFRLRRRYANSCLLPALM